MRRIYEERWMDVVAFVLTIACVLGILAILTLKW